MATRTAAELGTTIKQLIQMDLAELKNQEDTYIYQFMSLAMQKWARLAYQIRVSTPLNITVDGYQTFQQGAAPATDIFEPLRILDSTGLEAYKRTSFSAAKGWWQESANAGIHTKGLSGLYTLHYIKYPAWIADGGQTPEWPPAGYNALIYETMGMIKESKNFIEESNNMYNIAKMHMKAVVMANLSARGNTTAQAPSYADVDALRS